MKNWFPLFQPRSLGFCRCSGVSNCRVCICTGSLLHLPCESIWYTTLFRPCRYTYASREREGLLLLCYTNHFWCLGVDRINRKCRIPYVCRVDDVNTHKTHTRKSRSHWNGLRLNSTFVGSIKPSKSAHSPSPTHTDTTYTHGTTVFCRWKQQQQKNHWGCTFDAPTVLLYIKSTFLLFCFIG